MLLEPWFGLGAIIVLYAVPFAVAYALSRREP